MYFVMLTCSVYALHHNCKSRCFNLGNPTYNKTDWERPPKLGKDNRNGSSTFERSWRCTSLVSNPKVVAKLPM